MPCHPKRLYSRSSANLTFKQLAAAQTKAIFIATGTDASEATKMLTPTDDQSVPQAVALLKALAALKDKAKPANALLHSAWDDLKLWGELASGELLFYLYLPYMALPSSLGPLY